MRCIILSRVPAGILLQLPVAVVCLGAPRMLVDLYNDERHDFANQHEHGVISSYPFQSQQLAVCAFGSESFVPSQIRY